MSWHQPPARQLGALSAAAIASLLASAPARAEWVFVTPNRSDANRTVFVSDMRTTANCLVYLSDVRTGTHDAKAIWFYTPNRTDATLRVSKTRTDADMAVFFTPERGEAACR